jgi:hypothetical protein
MLVQKGKVTAILSSNTTKLVNPVYDSFSKYKIPSALSHEMTGKTVDGKDITVKISLGTRN